MTPSPTPSATDRASGLSIAALVVGIFGICIPGVPCIAIPLGIFAVIKADNSSSRGFAIGGLVASFLGMVTLGVVAAIAVPNFMAFNTRARGAECRTALRSAYSMARAQFAEKDAYTLDAAELLPAAANRRYVYVLGPKAEHLVPATHRDAAVDPNEARATVSRFAAVGLVGRCPDCAVTFACAGNIDSDPDLDVWSVSTGDRKTLTGVSIAPGEVFHHADDATDADNGSAGPPSVGKAAGMPTDTTPTDDRERPHGGLVDEPAAAPDAPKPFTDLPLLGFAPSPELQEFLDSKGLKTTKDVLAVDPQSVPVSVRDELDEFMTEAGARWAHPKEKP